MAKKKILVRDTDPVIYRITGYLPIIVIIIGWLFFLYDKRKVNEYLNDLFLSWEEIIIYTMYILEMLGMAITLYFIIMLIFKSRNMLYFSPVPFSLLILSLLTLPSLLLSAVIYSFIMDDAKVIWILLLTILPILMIFIYKKMPALIWLIIAALTGFIIMTLPLFIRETLAYHITDYRPYRNLLASNCMFYFSLLISFFVIREYVEKK